MTDKELLELAAKAAGIKKDDSPYNGGGFGNDGFDCMGNMMLDWHNNKRWNPLTDDGDALRLAVRLCFSIKQSTSVIEVTIGKDLIHHFVALEKTNRLEATRRAIVHAAAEIGKAMK